VGHFYYRQLAVAGCVLASMSFGAARAQTDSAAVMDAYRSTYTATIRCFVANGVAMDDYKDAQQPAQAAAYERKAAQSFDLAYQAGRKIGLSDSRIESDLDGARRTELPSMMRDKTYFAKAVAECRAVGLM
jgi:hypothetical protein